MSISQSINTALRRVPAWPIYIVSVIPPVWYLYLGFTGGLGFEPIKELEHRIGLLGFQVLLATLAISPIRKYLGVNLIRYRRALGLVGFFYIVCHLLVWAALDVQAVNEALADIVKRPYITIGMAGFALLIPLAMTSNNWSIRRMGPLKWRRLHQLSYATVILGGIHFIMARKGFQLEPWFYMGLVVVLLGLRVDLGAWFARPRRA
ncbi:MAG: protein-methionine-sulfoxide reductase heme-binding subunit MsrQ [Rhodobacteraceae bacterium]|nr:protein-methionine-sulfoxide reductase heme-binding subunit MsrQ [Paracoccaceae bacterium]